MRYSKCCNARVWNQETDICSMCREECEDKENETFQPMNDNKLIADFLGYESYEQGGYTIFRFPNNKHLTEMDLHYHDDWNELMPVVEECFNKNEDIFDDLFFKLNDALLETNIESLYRSVVEFIKAYNTYNDEVING